MKTTTTRIRHAATAAAFILAAISMPAADNATAATPLAAPAPVYNQPDAGSTLINTLPAGATPVFPSGENAVALPPGWLAVELSGPHTIYVRDTDLNKQLDPKPGVALRLEPKTDAPVLSTMEKGDTVELTGQKGRWIQFQLNRPVLGYIQSAEAAKPSPVTAAEASAAPASTVTPTPASVTPATSTGAIAPLPRSMRGIFSSTRRAFTPRRPYDYQLTDAAGDRYTYLDLSKLVMTEQIEKYLGRNIIVYGLAEAVPNTKDIVMRVETFQLAQ